MVDYQDILFKEMSIVSVIKTVVMKTYDEGELETVPRQVGLRFHLLKEW